MALERGSYDELMKVVINRRAVRMIKYAEIPDEVIRKVLEAGRWAPTGGNLQPWSFLVLKDRKKIRRIGQIYLEFNQLRLKEHREKRGEDFPVDAKRFYSDVGCHILVMGDTRLLAFYPFFRDTDFDPTIEPTLRGLVDLEDVNEFFYTKGVVPRGGMEVWLSSLAACIQNMQLAVWSLGYASVWMTVRSYQDQLMKELCGIPEHYHVMAVLPVGQAGENFLSPRYRKTLDHFTHYDEFDMEKELSDEELQKWAKTVRGQRMRPDNQVVGLPKAAR